ncbi:hypothetical protein BX616_000298 [Lobosporangium transversale]|uniref:Mediator of RNA polymerase II transcription subunit 1 n=1 Tax=Lobosporangium transversale TaxID=64571 RepID=A0A1Y2G970_9FUNG|nr:mediator of RNA polymerase II transcription subunit 1-domain-containing protein [Lobosporangium transversale]KAF9917665.1 hypothetical protein BX616_000298 [Lobosporangium transversale]ORZ04601.1 mediator of RNA polymerase II transcription subunit 1-domain-containing protein [Lobosporangium transversale]|eukprot:XP_021876647.1 mediator of RNA polymerase II transcription subunit 1-domain-containing protein [Lobosporangium transversale]
MPNTTNATTVQEHLRELQALVQDALKQWSLASTTIAATSLVAQTNPPRLTNELHPLGPVQVSLLQRDYKEKIAAIRTICLSFAQGPLQQSLNGSDSSSASSLRKYSSLLKEDAQHEEALSSVKLSMKLCQNTLRAASQDGSIKTEHLINTIRDMATGLGLECYLETGSRPDSMLPVSTLTIGGNVIVIDIDVESTGAILRVKVSYASEIHQDERIDRLLGHNLRCKCGKLVHTTTEKTGKATETKLVHLPDCSRDFDAFSKNLKALATLDSFSKKYPNIDFFHNIRSMDMDLKELFRREMSLTGRDLNRVLTCGHGIPMTHEVSPGPSVAYWASKADLLDVAWEELSAAIEQGANEKVKVPFHRINIMMEESTTPLAGYLPADRSGFLLSEQDSLSLTSVPYGSIMNDQGSVSPTTILQQPLRWIVPNTDSTVEAAYVAVLHPPVVVSEDVAKQLAALSNQAGLNTTMGSHKNSGYLSLQECLISNDNEQRSWEVTLDYGVNAVHQVYSFDRSKIEARLLHRVPFTHVSQIYICTKLLRQQLAFNTLFQSCFKATVSGSNPAVEKTNKELAATKLQTSIGSSSSISSGDKGGSNVPSESNKEDDQKVSIVIQTPQPPHVILASFVNPHTETNMTIEILIDAGTGLPAVRLINGTTVGSSGVSSGGVGGIAGVTGLSSISNMGNLSGSLVDMQQQQQQEQRLFSIEPEKLTKVLQMSDSIPILVRWILKRSFAWVKENLYQGKAVHQPSLSRRASTYTEEGGILKRPRV